MPEDQDRFVGKEEEIGDALFRLGLPLSGFKPGRGRRLQQDLPSFEFAEIGWSDSQLDCIPNEFDYLELRCPECGSDAVEEVVAEHAFEPEEAGDWSVKCPECGQESAFLELVGKHPFTLARCYLYVTDINPGDFDETAQQTVEQVLGPCKSCLGVGT